RRGAGRDAPSELGVRVGVEPGRSHLGAAGVVNASEEHGFHATSSWLGEAVVTAFGAPSTEPRRTGTSQANSAVAALAPTNWAAMNPPTSAGRMPAKVLLAARASVTAGLAKQVEAVNQ